MLSAQDRAIKERDVSAPSACSSDRMNGADKHRLTGYRVAIPEDRNADIADASPVPAEEGTRWLNPPLTQAGPEVVGKCVPLAFARVIGPNPA